MKNILFNITNRGLCLLALCAALLLGSCQQSEATDGTDIRLYQLSEGVETDLTEIESA